MIEAIPSPLNVKVLQVQSGYRLRVGNWRVIYTVQDDVLTVPEIEIA
jgi:mRNA-degrading endonuclease RelE of RelBE toxin-antitoxin system